MADSNSQRKLIFKSFIYLGLLFYLGYSLFIQDTNELSNQIRDEIVSSKSIIPTEQWQAVTKNAELTFNYLANDLGMVEYLNRVLVPEVKDIEQSEKGFNLAAGMFMSFFYTAAKNIPLLVFQSIYRWHLVLGWFFVFLPFIAALIIDGMYQWKLKRYVFGNVTIQFYRVWLKGFWLIGWLTLIYLLMPNMSLFNNIAQLFPPLALFILGIALNRLWSNYQKLM
ncbi:uncharacterized protein DUF4400 [Buttiauxella sp. BIGb0552]|uniref:DUF4400 domain-containing protein n=1 Tax=Buttiauxella sp. BIGb0552 TaxID=2485120 RepID=UPI001066B159|nr:DUF4400 domain-containing protein [Buttiauxella sp. BIGb0552]TDX11957.1 uncharacterized protein DUF4400 [Buttiauxella sp. BIGb0552]